VGQLELPNRLWDIDAKELESMGFDPSSIRAHAMAELGEELYSVKKNHSTASPMATSNSPTYGRSNSPMAGRSHYDDSSAMTMRAAACLSR
jgi:hypothetical protein